MVLEKGKQPSPQSSQRERWGFVFKGLVTMLESQQEQIEKLVKQRQLFQDRFQAQQERWLSDVRLLEDQVTQWKKKVLEEEMGRNVEIAKSELFVSLKQREALLFKLKLEHAESDLSDFRLGFDYLTHELSEKNEKSQVIYKNQSNVKDGEDGREVKSKILESEVKRLKRQCENLSITNEKEVSALMVERDFMWNQLKHVEEDYSGFQKNKRIEVEQANEKIGKLITSLEQLQSSNSEKDGIIAKLKADLAKLEAETDISCREISRLSKEIEISKNSKSAPLTPDLGCSTTGASTRGMERRISSRNGRPVLTKGSPRSQGSGIEKKPDIKERGSKRKEVKTIPSSDTPRLFSSTFKVPKLKNLSLPTT
ncbi:hypothetical protein IFM89_001175 [Coptis chinensis]|uniref:Uncharacterized protein n=1 Tax=Coptis chinensis TaxID=261450 RepID=A0A835ILH4_9MAGN|nr:hypothetical protein IFM89_001175 [Coptis chinensis]